MPFASNPSDPDKTDEQATQSISVRDLPDVNARDLRILAAIPTDDWATRQEIAERANAPYPTLSKRIRRLDRWYKTSNRKTVHRSLAYQRTVDTLCIELGAESE